MNKSLCENNPFPVPGQFSTPEKETSERKPFWPPPKKSGVWKAVKFYQIWIALGKCSGVANSAEHHGWGPHGLDAAICVGPSNLLNIHKLLSMHGMPILGVIV